MLRIDWDRSVYLSCSWSISVSADLLGFPWTNIPGVNRGKGAKMANQCRRPQKKHQDGFKGQGLINPSTPAPHERWQTSKHRHHVTTCAVRQRFQPTEPMRSSSRRQRVSGVNAGTKSNTAPEVGARTQIWNCWMGGRGRRRWLEPSRCDLKTTSLHFTPFSFMFSSNVT